MPKILLLEKEIKKHKSVVWKSLQRIGIVSVATILSRVLGLLRDVLMFAVFGASVWAAAFLFAFTLPNLFRRLLGEGSLMAALIPTLTEEVEERGKVDGLKMMSQVFSWLFLITSAIVVVGIVLFALVPLIRGLEDRWYLGSRLSIWLFPYLVFVCLAAAVGAALNVVNRFAVPALTAVWLNLTMIGALWAAGHFFAEREETQVLLLCVGVLIGGFFQLAVPFVALMREGWRPRLSFDISPRIREIYLLMLPGLIGTAIFQINVIVSRTLAFTVDEAGVAILYLANRLMEFPLGIFTIAVATVIFPLLARYAVSGEEEAFAESYRQGMRLILLISLPAAAGLSILSRPILRVLFEYGAFDTMATNLTVPILAVYAWALPLYSIATFATRGFHSVKNMSTPVRIAAVSFVVNLVFSVALMIRYGIMGLALANIVSIVVQSYLLQSRLRFYTVGLDLRRLLPDFVKMVVATVLMAAFLWAIAPALGDRFGVGKGGEVLRLVVSIVGGGAVYFLSIWLLRIDGRREIEAMIGRMIRRSGRGG